MSLCHFGGRARIPNYIVRDEERMPRELTDGDISGIKDLVVDLAGRTFVPDAGVTLGGQPVRDFLAGSVPSNPLSAIQQSIGRSACTAWARGEGFSITPAREAFMRDTCSPYISSIGVPPPGADYGPPFTGGQCTGTSYAIGWTVSCTDVLDGASVGTGNGTRPATGTAFAGPIVSITPVPATFGTTGLPQTWVARVVSAGGSNTRDLSILFQDVAGVGGRTERKIKAFAPSAVRLSGGADICGNPAPQWTAGGPGSGFPAPAPIPSPPGFDIPFPGITVGLNPDGTISIDFGDGGPPLVVDPGAVPGAGTGADPGEPEAGAPGATGDGGDEEGEAPPEKELWALKVDISSIPSYANQYAPGVYRGVCYVYMGDGNGLDHDPAGAMLRSGQLILAEREGLTRWRVSANVGYNLTITPYYRTPRKES